MQRKIMLWLIFLLHLNELIIISLCDVDTRNLVAGKFQTAIQQQNTISILSSIEERLRNLDNIYSMQLSQNLENKLDQYNAKLENLESKLMRLEALIMMNMGKISENISTKNFKDDIDKTDTLRKLDSMYESITHKLTYLEKKFEENNDQLQEKIENAFANLNQLEKDKSKRDSDLETELSTIISSIEDFKKSYQNAQQKIFNVTDDNLNLSKHIFTLLNKYNSDTRKSMNKLHDNIVNNLQYIDNRTTQHVKVSEETNMILKQMKIDLKEDFNSYANKVADMNSDMWKNSDTTEEDLRNIGEVVNITKNEVQNGIRSLMIQIGKIPQKDNDIITESGHKELEQKMTTNFEKVLTNQEVFLESCHRLQMDESQIESEISVMLNKLIDMLEKKLSSEVKDMKNLEKNLKNHDNRINRNLLQANQNIISLFEKTNLNTQMITSEIRKIGTDLNALFAFVQSTLNENASPISALTSTVFQDKLNLIEKHTKTLEQTLSSQNNITNYQIYKQITTLSKTIVEVRDRIQNYTRFENTATENTTKTILINDTLREAVNQVFGPPTTKSKKKCNTDNLIDIRYDDCEVETQKPKRKQRKRIMKYDIDIRHESRIGIDDNEDETTTEESTTLSD